MSWLLSAGIYPEQAAPDSVDKTNDPEWHMLITHPQKWKQQWTSKLYTQLQYLQVSAAGPNAKIIPGHTWSFTVTNERGRNQRYNYDLESCKAPEEANWVCRRHCRRGAELSRQHNTTVWKTRYTPATEMGPALPSFCCLVYNCTPPETPFIPHHVQKCRMLLALCSPVTMTCTAPSYTSLWRQNNV